MVPHNGLPCGWPYNPAHVVGFSRDYPATWSGCYETVLRNARFFRRDCGGHAHAGRSWHTHTGGDSPPRTAAEEGRGKACGVRRLLLKRAGGYCFAGAGFHCHFSSKKPASATPPGTRGVRGEFRSITAQSGSLATWRALLR